MIFFTKDPNPKKKKKIVGGGGEVAGEGVSVSEFF